MKIKQKKLIGYLLGFILLFTAFVLDYVYNDHLNSNVYFVGEGKINISSKEVIGNYNKFIEYFNKFGVNGEVVISKYNEKYFNNKSLAVIYEIVENTSINLELKEAKVDGNTVEIIYEKNDIGEIGRDGKFGYVIIVEIPKKVINIS